ncbi:MFS transporter [Chthoniobacter flavus]|nr:MFS transporter [Chthoniobacter flavus]
MSSPDSFPSARVTPQQVKSGLAAWLGWMFDGLDMHLYTLVALPFVAELMSVSPSNPGASTKASLIQGAFLFGWAMGGAVFGRIGDLLGRSRTLTLTILTYALFTGLSFFAQTWWHLLIFRFLAALGIGGEWAVGASLLAETWPSRWRPWLAAILQSAVNTGVLLACFSGWLLAGAPYRAIFLVGIVPALLTLWIRRAVPEPEVWASAASHTSGERPGLKALFGPELRRTTCVVIAVCALGLTAHWALMFWHSAHLRALARDAGWPKERIDVLANHALYLLTIGAIIGNFLAGWLARYIGYRRAIAANFAAYFIFMMAAYGVVRDANGVLFWLPFLGAAQGAFALFTMCLPPLFPTLLRTTGAGFCYNIGRVFAAAGTVVFGLFAHVGTGAGEICDHRLALLYSGTLFLPAALVAWFWLPEKSDVCAVEEPVVNPSLAVPEP